MTINYDRFVIISFSSLSPPLALSSFISSYSIPIMSVWCANVRRSFYSLESRFVQNI